jgi:hypothetical protein
LATGQPLFLSHPRSGIKQKIHGKEFRLHVVAFLLHHHQNDIKIVQRINAINYNTISLKEWDSKYFTLHIPYNKML